MRVGVLALSLAAAACTSSVGSSAATDAGSVDGASDDAAGICENVLAKETCPSGCLVGLGPGECDPSGIQEWRCYCFGATDAGCNCAIGTEGLSPPDAVAGGLPPYLYCCQW
jgi:hypothetical protein